MCNKSNWNFRSSYPLDISRINLIEYDKYRICVYRMPNVVVWEKLYKTFNNMFSCTHLRIYFKNLHIKEKQSGATNAMI